MSGPEASTAWEVAAAVRDPELPMLTLADLGVLRRVEEGAPPAGDEAPGPGASLPGPERPPVTVVLTPTYSGCPALATMRDDVVRRLRAAGYRDVRVRVELAPPWSSDWISERGRQALAAAGISPPAPARRAAPGPVPLTLTRSPGAGAGPAGESPACPRCGSRPVSLLSQFGATACQSLWRCDHCQEPFTHMKEI